MSKNNTFSASILENMSDQRLMDLDPMFEAFFDQNGYRNQKLFIKLDLNKPDIHPNKYGLGVLARCYIFVIRNNRFNPLGY